jgi:hypothetical protein
MTLVCMLNAWCIISSSHGGDNFHFSTLFRPALGPTQPPIQWVLKARSPGVKWPGGEADRSSPTSDEKLYIRSHICLHGIMLNYLSTGTTLHFNLQFKVAKLLPEPVFQYRTTESWRNCLVRLRIRRNVMASYMAMFHAMWVRLC